MEQDESPISHRSSRPDPQRAPHGHEAAERTRSTITGVVTAVVDVNDRVIRNLHECAIALTTILHDRSVLGDPVVETLQATIDTLDATVQEVRAFTFTARQHLQLRAVVMPRAQQRCLVRMEDEVVVAYACEGHTFRRAHDDTLWAHESEGILYSARSGVALAHRVGNIFYDPVTNVALYYEIS